MEHIKHRLEEVASAVVRLLPKLSTEEQQMDVVLYRLLAEGVPVPQEAIAETLKMERSVVSHYLKRVTWVQVNAAGEIVAFRGLTLKPTSHRFEIDGKILYTWCAFDTLFIPEILDKTARIESTCPVTENKIRLTVGKEGVSQLDPKEAVMSLVAPEASKAQENVIEHFCCYVHFFSSDQAGAKWISENQGKTLISVNEAYVIGQKFNRAQYEKM